MGEKIDTVIVGGGQAGLATSYYLKQLGREHIVLEQAAQAGNAWRNDRWDSFTLLTPNWSFCLPGSEYQGVEPDGFMPRDEIVETFEGYVVRYQLPVQYQTRVLAVEQQADGNSYCVRSAEAAFEARNVVIATGLFQQHKLPAFSSELSTNLTQLHSGQYRNPDALPPGAVLVVGSAQSGCQITEELYQSGRKVYLGVGSAGRAPRRYRGKDMYEWLYLAGFLDRTVDMLSSPKARFTGSIQVSGRNGGHSLNLHQFSHDGVRLLGRLRDGRGNKIWLTPDLKENLIKIDNVEAEIVKLVDGYITQHELDAPEENLSQLQDGFAAEDVSELDLETAGITSIIWAIGYRFDYNLVRLPVCDEDGFPIQKRGVTDYPGLYFVGMPWLYKLKSGLLVGMGEDAEFIASAIGGRAA